MNTSLSKNVAFDLETYPGNRWCVGFRWLDDAGKPATKIVETKTQLRLTLDVFQKQGKSLCGYNSERFDVPLVRSTLAGIDPYAPAQAIIKDDRLPAALAKLPPHSIDLIDLAARLRRGLGFPSLKSVAAHLGRPVLRELPYEPGKILDDGEWDQIKQYNLIDLDHTWELLVRLAPELAALAALSEEVDQDLRSVSTPQVVERVFKAAYIKANGRDPYRINPPASVRYRHVDGVVHPRTPAAAAWFDAISEPIPMISRGKRVVPDVPTAKFSIGKLAVSVGAGGLHSVDSARVYYSTKKHRLVSVDVASFYPSLIATKGISPASYGDVGRDTYRSFLKRRLAIKKQAKAENDPARKAELDIQADGLKLIVNSFFGKTGDTFSTLYDPEAFLAVTLSGQLMLIDLIERLTGAGVKVISANTDGLFIQVRRDDPRWREILKSWQADTGMRLDVDPLKRLAILASNQFATRDIKDRVKRKGGELRGGLDWNHAPNSLIVNDAVAQALLFDVPPEKTILGCRDFVRFCSVTKRSGKAVGMVLVDGQEETELPKVTRWYRAKESARRIAVRFAGGRHSTPEGAQAIQVCQDLPDSIPTDLDWSWYLGQARRKIQSVPGYRHRSRRLLLDHAPAVAVLDAGLLPVPKRLKAQPAGSDVRHPSLLWQWPDYPTVGTYTGPDVHALVVDVDDPVKFRNFVESGNNPMFGDRWSSLQGSLVSFHGDATAKGVRSASDRGKLIFRFDGDAEHPICRAKSRWLKSRGVEVFFGNGLPSISGSYDGNGDHYRLDGDLSEAPEWLVAALSPKERVKRATKATITPEAKAEALEGLPETLAEFDSRLGDPRIGWRRKDISGDREIWVGKCPFSHESGRSDSDDLHAEIFNDGTPYLKCKHESCYETQEIYRRLRLAYAAKQPAAIENSKPDDQAELVLPAIVHDAEPDITVNQEALDPILATYRRTDLGNAKRLVARFGHDLRFCHPWLKWLVWNAARWKQDDSAAAHRKIEPTLMGMFREASHLADLKEAELHAKHAVASESKSRMDAMLGVAQRLQEIPVSPDELDNNPWLFNCLNGTIDLQTGQLRLHNRDDMITQLCPVEYRPDAECPLWEQTLELFLPDPPVRRFFQRLVGYAMTGVVRDHVLPVCYGTGSNGKTTLLGTLLDLFGTDYAMKSPPELLMIKRNPGHTTERMDLFRKRLVVAIETEEGRRLNETIVKEFTGGDRIRGRRMREDNWEFSPTHKVFLATNHEPIVTGDDHGIWRRIKKVPFSVKMDDNRADKTMPERLKGEYPGILAWCLRGCLEWQRDGLQEPESVIQATQAYRTEQDIFGLFLGEHTRVDRMAISKASELYASYKDWAERSNIRPVAANTFGSKMKDKGFETKTNNGTWYLGIELRKPAAPGKPAY